MKNDHSIEFDNASLESTTLHADSVPLDLFSSCRIPAAPNRRLVNCCARAVRLISCVISCITTIYLNGHAKIGSLRLLGQLVGPPRFKILKALNEHSNSFVS